MYNKIVKLNIYIQADTDKLFLVNSYRRAPQRQCTRTPRAVVRARPRSRAGARDVRTRQHECTGSRAARVMRTGA